MNETITPLQPATAWRREFLMIGILGVVPLMLASGAGAEMRPAVGVAVFFGMLGVTVFGLIFTPVFYLVVRGLTTRMGTGAERGAALAASRGGA